jgi:hypothetical protein
MNDTHIDTHNPIFETLQELTTDLQKIEINENMRMCSLDLENMYTNIPKLGTMNIVNETLNYNPEINKKKQYYTNVTIVNILSCSY